MDKDRVDEGKLANFLTATGLVLGSLAPNTSLAQNFDGGDEKTKTEIFDNIKAKAKEGKENFIKLFNKITNKVSEKEKDSTEPKFTIEAYTKKAEKMSGFVGEGSSTNLGVAKRTAIFDARKKFINVLTNGAKSYKLDVPPISVQDEITFIDAEGTYTTYVIMVPMDKLSESFDDINNSKWNNIVNKLNPYQIGNEYSNSELIELILHYDTDYVKDNYKDLSKGIKDSKILTVPQKFKLGTDILDKTGRLTDIEREHLTKHYHKINNDKASEEGGFKY